MSSPVNGRIVNNLRAVRGTPLPRRVLSLDGGGVKGMAMLLILKRLFRTIQRDEHLPEIPRPCNYFDLIGGTSTGGCADLAFHSTVANKGANAEAGLSQSCLVDCGCQLTNASWYSDMFQKVCSRRILARSPEL